MCLRHESGGMSKIERELRKAFAMIRRHETEIAALKEHTGFTTRAATGDGEDRPPARGTPGPDVAE